MEAACFRQEVAFSRRLPDGTAIRDRANGWLKTPTEFWDDDVMEARHVEGTRKALTDLGLPAWVLRAAIKLRPVVLRMRRWWRAA